MERSTLKPLAAALALLGTVGTAQARFSDDVMRVAVLTDMSGAFSQFSGEGSVIAAKLAIEDCLAKECKGMKIDLVAADHQNKVDVALAKAREWFDRERIDVIADNVNSAVALAIQTLAIEKDKMVLLPGGPVRLSNENCAPEHSVQWIWDTYAQAAAVTRTVGKPGESWYFLTVDYAYGHTTEHDARAILEKIGAKVIGSSRHPLNNQDFSSQLLAAQASGADVIALANSGTDASNAIRQAREYGILGSKQRVVAFIPTIYEIQAIGLDTAQGLSFPESFYWDLDDGTRRFAARFQERYKKGPPSLTHAGVYSSVYHYLKSAAAAGSDSPKAVVGKMRTLPIEDDVVRNARLRPDGRMVHDYYFFTVKSPAESKGTWDLYKLEKVLPGDEVFLPLEASQCPAVRKASA